MSERASIVVVGAGPAGAVAARQLARRGRDVLLVDKARFPRPKVCGGCLSDGAVAMLHAVGIGVGGMPLHGFHLRCGQREARVRLPGGVAIARHELDMHLVDEAVAAGARFEDGSAVRLCRAASDGRPHMLEIAGRLVEADVLVAADGIGGRLLNGVMGFEVVTARRSRIGLGAVIGARSDPGETTPRAAPAAGLEAGGFEPGVIHMSVGRGGYVGVVAMGDGSVNVAAALEPAAIRAAGGANAAVAQMLGQRQGLAGGQWCGTPRLTRRRRAVAGERLFVIGDSAGYIEPFTGEGMAWAIAAGAGVAPLAGGAVERWEPTMAKRWEREHRRAVRRQQRMCRAVAGVLRRPVMVSAAAAALAWSPDLASPVLEHLGRSEATGAAKGTAREAV